ncbi:hypothetical protein N234_36495 [Ralstonia pickettii DTP0602]|nr:hypothetical protein N234_18790 [Ralstonia pickettii DTP0602]AGW95565.1 hypothetical protein N234_36495 [Ralstonia pickettii DTP0602]
MDKTLSGRRAGGVYKRPNFPAEFKRRLVEQSFEPGASVALVARSNDINANLLFKWRRHYLDGAYGLPTSAEGVATKQETTVPALLPVSIVAEAAAHTPAAPLSAAQPSENVCEIEFDRARLRIRGEMAPDMLRLLIRELSR